MPGADVRSIQALEDLRAQLVRFGDEAEAALCALEMELRRTQEYLGERRRHWEAKVRAAEEEYRQALHALVICRSRGYTDPKTGRTYIPPCSQEGAWVERARRQLAECQARLREVLEWQRLVERSAAEYHRQAQRMAAWLQQDLPNEYSVYINDAFVLNFSDNKYASGAFIIDNAANSSGEIKLDYIRIYRIP